ncbi:MAG: hypothetical protein R6V55_11405 [Desulfovermiculus sp.]
MNKITIETMSHCEAEVLSKDVEGKDCILQALDILERMRSHSFQAVVWDQDQYLGGIWYNPTHGRWTAELFDIQWDDEHSAAQAKERLQTIGT